MRTSPTLADLASLKGWLVLRRRHPVAIWARDLRPSLVQDVAAFTIDGVLRDEQADLLCCSGRRPPAARRRPRSARARCCRRVINCQRRGLATTPPRPAVASLRGKRSFRRPPTLAVSAPAASQCSREASVWRHRVHMRGDYPGNARGPLSDSVLSWTCHCRRRRVRLVA